VLQRVPSFFKPRGYESPGLANDLKIGACLGNAEANREEGGNIRGIPWAVRGTFRGRAEGLRPFGHWESSKGDSASSAGTHCETYARSPRTKEAQARGHTGAGAGAGAGTSRGTWAAAGAGKPWLFLVT